MRALRKEIMMIARHHVADQATENLLIGQDDTLTGEVHKHGETEKQAVAEAVRSEWITQYGSPYLKKMDAAGYHCQPIYVKERAALEHPGYMVDFGNKCDWRERACPSESALDKAIEDGGEVVWLTQVAPGLKDGFRGPCEAVVIRKYLGKFNLVTILV